MDFRDISARLKKARDDREPQSASRATDYDQSYEIRAKMIGVLLRDARMNAGRTLDHCANLLKVTPEVVESWEFGDDVPSLPQLELLAYYLDVPVSHFWGNHTMESARQDHTTTQSEYMALRDRLVGALLRQAREDMGLSLDDLSDATGIPSAEIDAYELGEVSMPMHKLTVLANEVRKNLNYFLESSSKLGELLAIREAWKYFSAMPEDVRRFAASPLNVGFMELAMMLSQMPTERLRSMGESILNITM
ncbi:MAG: helix-turn-helix transcriptional regulator [Chloroflexota bacterium]|nr:helix-turn-helix transcriptional regulator [Chloroflexota bacterium]